jgi:protein-disulfide isomerase
VSALLDTPRLTVPVGERDHVHGPPTAPVTLVEYGDYECPFCGAAHQVVHELQRMLADDLRFAFRHFPLTQIHHRALGAALAAEAAGAQGRFWDMHDLLFANQESLGPQAYVALARTLALDLPRFTRDFEQETYAPRVREDFMSGVRSGVNGTPTFFINGVRHNGGFDLRSMLDAIGDVSRVGSL